MTETLSPHTGMSGDMEQHVPGAYTYQRAFISFRGMINLKGTLVNKSRSGILANGAGATEIIEAIPRP
jgi:hypothetical protein